MLVRRAAEIVPQFFIAAFIADNSTPSPRKQSPQKKISSKFHFHSNHFILLYCCPFLVLSAGTIDFMLRHILGGPDAFDVAFNADRLNGVLMVGVIHEYHSCRFM
jgi:hypothetical protein